MSMAKRTRKSGKKVGQKKKAEPPSFMRTHKGKTARCQICRKPILQDDGNWQKSQNPVSRRPAFRMKNGQWSEKYYHMKCELERDWPQPGGDD